MPFAHDFDAQSQASSRDSDLSSLEYQGPRFAQPKRIVQHLGFRDETGKAFTDARAMLDNKSTCKAEFYKQAGVNYLDTNTANKYRNGAATVGNYLATAVKGFFVGLFHIITLGFVLRSARDTTNDHLDRLNAGSFTVSDRLQRPGLSPDQKNIEGMRLLAGAAPLSGDTFEAVLGGFHPDAEALGMNAHGHVLFDARSNADMADIREEMKPQLQSWLDSIKAVGANATDEQYRALIAIVTDKVASNGLRGSEQTWLVENVANFYGKDAVGRVANDVAKEVKAKNPADMNAAGDKTVAQEIKEKIATRAQTIADATGRDVREIEHEIYAALNQNQAFITALKGYEDRACASINGHRDLAKLQATFLEERMSTLTALSMYQSHIGGQKATGEGYLRQVLELGGIEAFRAQIVRQQFADGNEGNGATVIKNAEDIMGQFESMHNFLANLEEDFGRYVADHEAQAQEQLDRIATLQVLRYDLEGEDFVGKPHTADLDEELQGGEHPRVTAALQHVEHDAISDRDLAAIFDTLIGDGTPGNPGAPTMAFVFLQTLAKRTEDQGAKPRAELLGVPEEQLAAIAVGNGLKFVINDGDTTINMGNFNEEAIAAIRQARHLGHAQHVAAQQQLHVEEELPPVVHQQPRRLERSPSFSLDSQDGDFAERLSAFRREHPQAVL